MSDNISAALLRAINDCHLDPARAILQADRLAGEAIIRAHAAEAEVERLAGIVDRARMERAQAEDAETAAEARADRLAATLAQIEALAAKFERWPSSPSLAVTAREMRAILDAASEVGDEGSGK